MDGIKSSFFFFFLNASRHNTAEVLVALVIGTDSLAWEYSEQKLYQSYLARENCNLRDLSKTHKWYLCLCASILVQECAGKDKEKECLGHRVPCPALLPLECWSQAKTFRRNADPFHGSDKHCTLIHKPNFLLTPKNPTKTPQNHTADFSNGCGTCAQHMYANAKGFHLLKWKKKKQTTTSESEKSKNYLGVLLCYVSMAVILYNKW